jgi:hypothetical protein
MKYLFFLLLAGCQSDTKFRELEKQVEAVKDAADPYRHQRKAANIEGCFNPWIHFKDGMPNKGAISHYYDEKEFWYRPYLDKKEVYKYLCKPEYRYPNIDVIVNTGGVIDTAKKWLVGGKNAIYRFKNDSLIQQN